LSQSPERAPYKYHRAKPYGKIKIALFIASLLAFFETLATYSARCQAFGGEQQLFQ
jgi:hypothetical protein